jgi:small multidrug resistance family-3 protein
MTTHGDPDEHHRTHRGSGVRLSWRHDRTALCPAVRPGRDRWGWLVWQGVREHRGLAFVGAGILVLGLYGFVTTSQPEPYFGRILAAYGGVFLAGSLAWGMAVDGFGPDRCDLLGAALCLAGVAVTMYALGPARPIR